MKSIYKNQSGFTFIELMIAIAIIGILSSIVTQNILNAREKARIANGLIFDSHLRSGLGDQALGTWDFKEGSTSVIKNYLGITDGNGHGVSLISGVNNSPALKFDGGILTSYVQIPNSINLPDYTQNLTISAWVKLDGSVNSWGPISFKTALGYGSTNLTSSVTNRFYNNSINRSWFLGFDPNKTNRITWSNGGLYIGGAESWALSCDIPDTLNTWRHIAASYKKGVGRKIYVDGKLICTDNATGTINKTSYPIYIGGGDWDPQFGEAKNSLNGSLENVRIYGYALE